MTRLYEVGGVPDWLPVEAPNACEALRMVAKSTNNPEWLTGRRAIRVVATGEIVRVQCDARGRVTMCST